MNMDAVDKRTRVGTYANDTVSWTCGTHPHSDVKRPAVQWLDSGVPSQHMCSCGNTSERYTGDYKRLRIALRFEPAFLVNGDRLWWM
jgi:hypothetical protein